MHKEAEIQIRNGMDYCYKNKAWPYYYRLYSQLISILVSQHKYELVQREAKKFYEEAKKQNRPEGMVDASLSLAEIYLKKRRYSESEICAKECITLSNTLPFNNICYELQQAYHFLTMSLIFQKKYDNLLQELQKQEQVLENIEELEPVPGNKNLTFRLHLYNSYATYYFNIKDYDKADDYCDLMDEILLSRKNERTEHHADCLLMRAQILQARGQYVKAMEMTEKYAQIFYPTDLTKSVELLDFLKLKASLLMRLGKEDESIDLYDSIISSAFNIRDAEFNARIDELRTLYGVDKHIAEKQRTRYSFLLALWGCILLSVVLGILIYYNRIIIRKNQGAFRQIKEQNRLVEQLHVMTKQYEQLAQSVKNKKSANINEELHGSIRQRNLVSRLRDYLLSGKYFTKSEINGRELATNLATNKTYLYESIKAVTGKTLNEYIQFMRVEEAKKMIEQNPHFTIENIAEACGFNSRATFYRLFGEQYNISPTKYREMARKQLATTN